MLSEVRSFNSEGAVPRAAYTHDAGAHVHVFTLSPHVRALRHRIDRLLGVRSTSVLRPGAGAREILGRSRSK